MTWQVLTAISVVGLSLSILLQRVLLSKDKSDPVAYVVLFQALVGLLTLVAAVINGFELPNFAHVWLPALGSVVLYGVGHVVYAKTLQRVEASVFTVLFASHAVWVMLLGVILFHESLGVVQLIGAGLIFASILMLVPKFGSLKLDKGTLLGLLTGLIFGLAMTCWGFVGRYVDTLSWAALSFMGPALVALAISPKSVYKMKPFFKGQVLKRMLLLGILYSIGCVAMLFSYKVGDFSLVSPVRQSGVILTVLLALAFFSQERHNMVRKIAAACICFVGVLLMI